MFYLRSIDWVKWNHSNL